MDNYEKLLDKARKELPDSVLKVERFEIPKVRGHIQGNRTVINNFHQIAAVLHRKVEHLLKFVLKELAAPGELKTSALIIGAKIPAARINDKIQKYAVEFVICPECKKPDTKLVKEGNVTFIKCLACGARHPVKAKMQ
ncbi:translation initiation factor IF-2 subunit beta [Candidatus Woesearchaeota archaeon]|nr:translation initiation factor IF-2 subunit beta [Candidatus Woesearchaeota archaeon]